MVGGDIDRRLVIEIPVPEVDAIARALQDRYAPTTPVREPLHGAAFAHVSIAAVPSSLAALDEGTCASLATACAGVERFTFSLWEIGMFDGRAMYLAPSPEEPFRLLMNRCARVFDPGSLGPPANRSVPHVTILYGSASSEVRRAVEADVRPLLPVHAEAVAAHLVLLEPGRRSLLERFPLGRHLTSDS